MNKTNIFTKNKGVIGGLMSAAILSVFSLSSCKETIDESDLYTFTGEMMIDHFENNPKEFSSYLTLLNRVKPSQRSKSTMRDLLSARGNYTCFAPTNEAIQQYLDSVMNLPEPLVSTTDVNLIPDSVAQEIVFNSIIQNGNDLAFKSTDFEEGALKTTNMNDRYVSISYGKKTEKAVSNNDTISYYTTVTYVNTYSAIVEPDIEVANGYIHAIDHVLAPSNATIAGLILTTPNTTFFGELLKLTGYDAQMAKIKDVAWEVKHDDIRGQDFTHASWKGKYPEFRKFGFTVFLETNDVFEAAGITDLASLKEYVKEHANFDDDTSRGNMTSWGEDYENPYNWLNQFVAYHILPESLTYNTMVTFANEYGTYAGQMKNRTASNFYVNVWEYWETMGIQRRLMKVTGYQKLVGGSRIISRAINRASKYNNKTYKEDLGKMEILGIDIAATNGDYTNNALNGWYYPIDQILLWNSDVPNKVLNERLRFDITSLFPEFLNNNIKQNRAAEKCGSGYWYFTPDYIDNVVAMSDETKFIYLPNQGYSGGINSWMNYQIDEFNIQGIFDFTMKLPPVPYTGTYEIRYGINANNNRGMAQVYFGKNKNNLPAIGIPLDLRTASGTNTDATGWVKDDVRNDEANAENDKSMRNLGFMKGPKYIQLDASNTGRSADQCLRKIIYTGVLEAGETYYIRFKSVLAGDTYEFFFDYLELVPKSVYAGDEAEDIW